MQACEIDLNQKPIRPGADGNPAWSATGHLADIGTLLSALQAGRSALSSADHKFVN